MAGYGAREMMSRSQRSYYNLKQLILMIIIRKHILLIGFISNAPHAFTLLFTFSDIISSILNDHIIQ